MIYPMKERFVMQDAGILNLEPWKFAKGFSIFLVVITIVIYALLGSV
jgi:SSS family solute:Na+ symporter